MRSREQLLQALQRQAFALRASARGYDAGDHWEVARIAASVHIITRDVGRNVSLLCSLGLSDHFLLPVSSLGLEVDGPVPSVALAKWDVSKAGEGHIPVCALRKSEFVIREWLPLRDWLHAEVAYAPSIGTLTRDRIIASIRDQDGGAHFDVHLSDAAYRAFAHEPESIWIDPATFKYALQASVRQMAEEVLGGLEQLNIRHDLGLTF